MIPQSFGSRNEHAATFHAEMLKKIFLLAENLYSPLVFKQTINHVSSQCTNMKFDILKLVSSAIYVYLGSAVRTKPLM